jgi:uncharacterized protein YcbX
MTGHLAQIWRHPIKGIGAERLDQVQLHPDQPLPLDRAWAVLEAGGETSDGWRACRNFIRGAKGPSLMAVTARVAGASIQLSHPDRPDLVITPGTASAAQALIAWLSPIYPADRPPPTALVPAPAMGMSDVPYASVAVLNLASLRALSEKLGQTLDPRRFRGNLWLDGGAAWAEFDLVGKDFRIGAALLEGIEPITRCRATEANPDTGQRDAATLSALEAGWGHTDFGIYAMVREPGHVATGDRVVLP